MDIPSKWSLRSGLLGLGITALHTAHKLSNRSAAAVKSDPPFPTHIMAKSYRSRPRTVRRMSKRRAVVPRNVGSMFTRSMRRCNANALITTLSGVSVGGYILSPQLSFVPNSDLLASYRLYRIRKCVFTCIPRVDTSNSGVANNFQAQITAACNPEGPVAAPTSITDMTIYDNWHSKHVVSGDRFVYTYYPKVTNTVQGPSATVASGSYSGNPWLKLDTTGITVPHQQLLVLFQTGANTTITFDGYLTIYFDVRV